MTRPPVETTMLKVALELAARATCPRRQVGAVLTDRYSRILSTGYNGAAHGQAHCSAESPCPGFSAASGQGLDLCDAIHAEANALMFCPDIMKIDTCYVTTAPCSSCVKLLLNTSCQRIVFLESYASDHMELARERWLNPVQLKREWIRWELDQ